MEFFTVYQTPYVFVKNRTQFFNVHVDNLDRTTPLKMFHRDNTERVVIPVFKSREDATRFQRSAIQMKTCCHTFDTWKTAEVYPIDVNMSHLSLTAKMHTVPKYLWDECELYEPTPLDLNDIDAILSLSLKAHIGYFVVGTFNILENTLSINGVVVDSNLHHEFTDQEHMALLQTTYERIYLT